MENDDNGLTELVVKAKRKLKYEEGDEHEWLKNKNKILRMQSQNYKGLKPGLEKTRVLLKKPNWVGLNWVIYHKTKKKPKIIQGFSKNY